MLSARRGVSFVATVALAGNIFQLRAFCSAPNDREFDMIVIGGGSGGISCAKRSASHGARVALVEGGKYGGTCVNVGCVPKKMMYNAAHVAEVMRESHEFGFSGIGDAVTFDWASYKTYRDRYIARLNGLYENGLKSSGVTRINGMASFVDPQTIRVNNEEFKAKHIVVAVGGTPNKLGVPGDEYCIDSDGFFALETQPKSVAVIGAGYIAVELAGVFHSLGSETTLLVRGDHALRKFDDMLSTSLDKSMRDSGVKVVSQAVIKSVKKGRDGLLTINLADGRSVGGFEVVLRATGRSPQTETLNLRAAGVKTSPTGHIVVDEYQNSSSPGVYALGDVVGKVELTPMAIAAGRRLGDRLFGNLPTAKADYSMVPTVVFSHPVIGTIGCTEAEAREKFGAENLKIYTSSFVNLWYGSYYKGKVGDKPITKYKLICEGPTERVVGLHCIGMSSDEVIQGFGVAMKMGATKADFDDCVAIHPTASEEFVTMAPWGLSPEHKNKFQ